MLFRSLYLENFETPVIDEMNEDYMYESKAYPTAIPIRLKINRWIFEPITILYGGNGSGKSTLLNLFAEKLNLKRLTPFNDNDLFYTYLNRCNYNLHNDLTENSRIITSDDVFSYMLDVRDINHGIDTERQNRFKEYKDKKYAKFRFKSMDDLEELKKINLARSKSSNQYANNKLMKNIREYSNGESAFQYFAEKFEEEALYLLDEPENSLSPERQIQLAQMIEDSARFYKCQFVIATHSPFLLSLRQAKIYDLDNPPVKPAKWTELKNIRTYFDFFEKHRSELLPCED